MSDDPIEPEVLDDEGRAARFPDGREAVTDWHFYAPGGVTSGDNLTVTPDSRAPADVLIRAQQIRMGLHFIPGMARLIERAQKSRGGDFLESGLEVGDAVVTYTGLTTEEQSAWRNHRELPSRAVTFEYEDVADAMACNPKMAGRVWRDWAEWAEAMRAKSPRVREALGGNTRWTAFRVLEPLELYPERDRAAQVVVDQHTAGLFIGVNSAGQVIVEFPTWQRAPGAFLELMDGKAAAMDHAKGLPVHALGDGWRMDEVCRWQNVRCDPHQIEVFTADDLCHRCGGFGEPVDGGALSPTDPRCATCGGHGFRPDERTGQWTTTTRPPMRSKTSRAR